MTVDTADLVAELCQMLQQYNKENLTLSGKTKFSQDLNIDSVEVMDLVMEIEDKFNIDIPINLLSDIECVEDLANVVKERMKDL
jgi:acyl carrier protein